MLVLTRKINERILIGDNIRVTVVAVRGNQVRVGIEAPNDVRIFREELCDAQNQNQPTRQPAPGLLPDQAHVPLVRLATKTQKARASKALAPLHRDERVTPG